MCELATIGTIVSIGGTLMSAMGATQTAQANQDDANYKAGVAEQNAAVARNNADYARRQANDEIDRGNEQVQDHLRKVAALKGTQTASMAARGIDVSEGTAANIIEDTDLFGQLDAMTIRDNAAKNSFARKMDGYNFDEQARGALTESRMYSSKANSISPMMAGVSSLVSGAGSVAEKWYAYKKVS